MPTNYSPSFAANAAVRALLQAIGDRYDKAGKRPVLSQERGRDLHKVEAMKHQDWRCCYCRKEFDASDRSLMPHREHLVSMSQDSCGLHTWRNVLFACAGCNQEKEDKEKTWQEFSATKHADSTELIRSWVDRYPDDSEYVEKAKKLANTLYETCTKAVNEAIQVHSDRASG